ncbi:MAG TPA: hypothetical protein VH307_12800 [Streptosporangiaceae bacterium]|nr:hypothetical protein [Streptosporangiaceae bacterium]
MFRSLPKRAVLAWLRDLLGGPPPPPRRHFSKRRNYYAHHRAAGSHGRARRHRESGGVRHAAGQSRARD